jgi:hypothetical protein
VFDTEIRDDIVLGLDALQACNALIDWGHNVVLLGKK